MKRITGLGCPQHLPARAAARGFTLVELMVTLAIMGIFLSLAVPSFTTFVQNNRDEAAQLDLLSSISFARSEAIKRGVPVMLSAAAPSSVGNELGGGWSVWVDLNGNGTMDSGAEILRVHGAITGDAKLSWPNASTEPITFSPSGYSAYRDSGGNLASVAITVCDNRHNSAGGQISVLPSGAVSLNPNFVCS